MRACIFFLLLTITSGILSADIQPALHSLKTPYPGKTDLPLWGIYAWSLSVEEIDKAAQYGANLLYVLNSKSGQYLPLISTFYHKGFLVDTRPFFRSYHPPNREYTKAEKHFEQYLLPTSPSFLSEHSPFSITEDWTRWRVDHPEDACFFSTIKSCCVKSPPRPILLDIDYISSPHPLAQLVSPLKAAHAYTKNSNITSTLMNNILKLVHLPGQNGSTLLYDPKYFYAFDHYGIVLSENFLVLPYPTYKEEIILQLGQEDGSSREFLPPYKFTFGKPQSYPEHWFVLSPKSASEIPESLGHPPTLPRSIHIALPLDPGTYKLHIKSIPQTTEDPPTSYSSTTYFSVSEPTTHIITIDKLLWPPEQPFDYITLTRISPIPEKTTILEPAGYIASLKQELILPDLLVRTTYMIESNTPYIRARSTLIKTRVSKEPVPVSLGFKGYKTLRAFGKEYNGSAEFEYAPSLFSLRGASDKPDIGIVLSPKGGSASLKWSEEDGITLYLNFSGRYALNLAVVVEDGLYDHMSLYMLSKPFRDELPVLTLPPNSTQTRTNLLEVPISYTYRITNPKPTPYMVCETGSDGVSRWYYRPALPSYTNPGEAYLKLYFQSKGLATISTQKFIEDSLRFAPGSQYLLAFSNIKRDTDTLSFTADVLYSHPLILAPTAQVNGNIASATLNGRDWCYFEGDLLRLPNKAGTYNITVKLSGAPRPHLERTYAVVSECWYSESENSLTISFTPPPNWKRKENTLSALINCAGKKIKEIQGGILKATQNDKAILSFPIPSQVKILFSP